MEIGTRVRNTETGKFGVIVSDIYGCCDNTEEPVVYDGSTAFLGTDKGILESAIGPKPVPDVRRCGAGKGADCCIFITVGKDGPCCERFTSMRDTLILKTRDMTAQRNPTEPYPECMKFE